MIFGKLARFLLLLGQHPLDVWGNIEETKPMNILMTISEAMHSAHDMDRDSQSILGLCNTSNHTKVHRLDPGYSNYLRRRDRNRRAA